MVEGLAAAYRATDYRIRLPGGGYASVRIGRQPPAEIQAMVDNAPSGIITAWNPGSRPSANSINRKAQRALLAALKSLSTTRHILAAVGAGQDGWFERSLFVVGPVEDELLDLCLRYGQRACVVCSPGKPARLCWRPAD